jgi:hypothetical protein
MINYNAKTNRINIFDDFAFRLSIIKIYSKLNKRIILNIGKIPN